MKHTSSILTVAFSLVALASSYALPGDNNQTFSGKVALSGPSVVTASTSTSSGAVPGARLANLGFSGTIQSQDNVNEIVNFDTQKVVGFSGTLQKAARVSNSTILSEVESLLPGGSKKGFSLRVVLFYDKDTTLGPVVVQAFKKGSRGAAPTVVNIPSSVLGLYFGWTADLDGIFKNSGTASATVSKTASGTAVLLTQGSLSGFTLTMGELKLGSEPAINFSGVGSFKETTKGFSGSANVSGDNLAVN